MKKKTVLSWLWGRFTWCTIQCLWRKWESKYFAI